MQLLASKRAQRNLWGGLNGFYLVFSIVTEKYRNKITTVLRIDKLPVLHKAIKVFITFNLISFAWIFFRAKNLADALFIVKHIFGDISTKLTFDWVGITRYDLFLCSILIITLLFIQLLQRKKQLSLYLDKKPIVIRWAVYYAGILAILLLGVFTTNSFIYFQF